jgi:glutamyl-tRNA reductase
VSLLVVGLSHRSAPVSLLERAALGTEAVGKLLGDAAGSAHVSEAVVVSTCNRTEVYAQVHKFHGALADLSELIALHAAVPLDELTPHLYVHYESRAVRHLFSVACGLDSMVVGEPQVLGQLRTALNAARQAHTAGRTLDGLVQQALRVGKRARSSTELDAAGRSVVTVALDAARATLGTLDGRRALVVGAGSMSALATLTLHRAGVTDITVANRTPERAQRLAAEVSGVAVPLDALPAALPGLDLLVTCTGSASVLIDAELLAARGDDRPLVVVDLALPRDVDPAARDLPGVTVVDLETIAASATADGYPSAVIDEVTSIVADEVAEYDARQRGEQVAPTVAALRAKAADVVSAELGRLDGRLPDLDRRARAEIARTVNRVVDKLLHAPTVRVKQFAREADGASYADALRELFDLDPAAVGVLCSPVDGDMAVPEGNGA